MIEITKKMIDQLEKIVNDCENLLPSSKVLELANVKRVVPEISFGSISSFDVKRAIATALLLYADTKKIDFNIRRLNEYIQSTNSETFETCRSLFDSLCREESGFSFSPKRSCFRNWKRGILFSDLIYRKGSTRENFVQHCIYFEKLDLVGLEFLVLPFKEINLKRLVWYQNLEWFTEDAQELMADFFYQSFSTEAFSEWTLFKYAFYLEKKMSENKFVSRCSIEQLFSLLSSGETAPLGRYLSFHWMHVQFERNPEKIYDFDTWKVEWFSHNRKNQDWTGGEHTLNFSKIKDEKTKKIVKKYCMYLLNVENLSFGVIVESLRQLSYVYSDIGTLLNITQQQTIDYCAKLFLNRCRIKDSSIAEDAVLRMIFMVSKFFDWCCSHELFSENPWFFVKGQYHSHRNKIVKRAISPYVLQQIFRVLPECPDERMKIIFLVIFDSGMRGEDATALKKNSIVINGEMKNEKFCVTGGYLYYDNHKFHSDKKCVVLSPAVAMLLDEYRQQRIQNDDSPFLFPRYDTKSKHIVAPTFRQYMSKFFAEKGVKNEDGSTYKFEVHSLRHTAAVRMKAAGVSIEAISAQLDHHSIEMTYRYLDDLDEQILEKNKIYIDVNGQKVDSSIGDSKDTTLVEEAMKKLRAKLLPNGFCERPSVLKSCPHFCTCISGKCSYFRTDIRYLPVHEQQLQKERQMLAECDSEPEKKTHEVSIEVLSKVINGLKETTIENISMKEVRKNDAQVDKKIS